jgi:hypothetical protein
MFSKNTQISSLMKICPVGVELFQADEQMDGYTGRYDGAKNLFSQFFERA